MQTEYFVVHMEKKSVIIIGAGIVGLATARALAIKGYTVKVFDRNPQAVGASVRNFGMIWPIGQPAGKLYNRAKRTREIWQEIATETKMWCATNGSLHVAYNAEEWQILQELNEAFLLEGRPVNLLHAEQVQRQYAHVQANNLLGGLYCAEEMLVDPREAIVTVTRYLNEKFNVQFFWNKCVSYIADQTVYIGNEEEHAADLVFVCSGVDFETLYPETFAQLPLTKCKLQMLRTVAQPTGQLLLTSICGGLSLLHYQSFKVAPSLPDLQKKMFAEKNAYLVHGIHVMAAQNGKGEIVIGDSHEYGLQVDPFDKTNINKLILDYLQTFLKISDASIAETWHGVYPKLTNGENEIFLSPEAGVYILNGLGGAGMTLSFGLAEEIVEKL